MFACNFEDVVGDNSGFEDRKDGAVSADDAFFICTRWLPLLLLYPMVVTTVVTFVASVESCANGPRDQGKWA